MKTLSLFPMKTAQPPLVGSTARTGTSMTVLFTVLTVLMEGRKTSCSSRAAVPDERFARIFLAPKVEMIVSVERRKRRSGSDLTSGFWQPCQTQHRRQAADDCNLAACAPRIPAPHRNARDLPLLFFESTLHV